MVILKYLILFSLLIASGVIRAEVTDVQVKCTSGASCEELQHRAEGLIIGKNSREDIEKAIEFLLLDQSIDRLSYEIVDKDGSGWQVNLDVVPKLKILNLDFRVSGADLDLSSLQTVLPYKEGGFFETDFIPDSKK